MKLHTLPGHPIPAPALPALLVALLAYGVLLRIQSIFVLCLFVRPFPHEEEAYRAAFSELGSTMSVINACWAALLLLQIPRAFEQGGRVRRGHLAGIALGLLYVAGVQWLILNPPPI